MMIKWRTRLRTAKSPEVNAPIVSRELGVTARARRRPKLLKGVADKPAPLHQGADGCMLGSTSHAVRGAFARGSRFRSATGEGCAVVLEDQLRQPRRSRSSSKVARSKFL
mmetsp:Transcript_2076/g.7587  ORF Transcript_2076/g.7587 Transcript_2076/m.7587 type:complete len:110 (+) Transcript_2076:747-1076(+)